LVLVPTIPLLGSSHANGHGTLRLSGACYASAATRPGPMPRTSSAATSFRVPARPIPRTSRLRCTTASRCVLCTYDSSPVLAEAMRVAPEFAFDLAIADEAHRCAGLEASRASSVLYRHADRYGTRDKSRAANKNVRLGSMDDRALFGPVVPACPSRRRSARVCYVLIRSRSSRSMTTKCMS
jgi:hypothetical protein